MSYLRVLVLKYNIDLGTDEAQRVSQRVQNELIPLLKSKPGFVSYQSFVANNQPRTSVSVTSWATAEQAEAGTKEVTAWIQEILGPYLVGSEAYSGDVILAS